MRPPEALNPMPIYGLWPGSAFRSAQYDMGHSDAGRSAPLVRCEPSAGWHECRGCSFPATRPFWRASFLDRRLPQHSVHPRPFMSMSNSSAGMRARMVGFAILYPFKCRMGSTATRTGSRNLLECQLVASGPVSDSPSPTATVTIRSGLSNAAPNPWRCCIRVRRPRESSPESPECNDCRSLRERTIL